MNSGNTVQQRNWRLTGSVLAMGLVLGAAPAFAAAAAEDQATTMTAEEKAEGESATIVVTGTRRTDRTVTESSVPVDVFTAGDIKTQPAPQLQTIL